MRPWLCLKCIGAYLDSCAVLCKRVLYVFNCRHCLSAFGCPDPQAPHGGLIKQRGDSVVMFGCSDNQETWQLRCHGVTWVGEKKNCTKGNSVQYSVLNGGLKTVWSYCAIYLIFRDSLGLAWKISRGINIMAAHLLIYCIQCKLCNYLFFYELLYLL